jgi:uncharacterized membrane protein YhdT
MMALEVRLANEKRCPGCFVVYKPGHFGHSRENCPACGARLIEMRPGEDSGFTYEHYDSNVDIQFDLTGLLNPDQRREAWAIGITGAVLVLVAFVARILFVVLGELEGFWGVPLWFDVLVGVMILVGVVAAVWGLLRLIRHYKAVRRRA